VTSDPDFKGHDIFSTLNISEITLDRAIITIEHQKEVSCAVSLPMTFSDYPELKVTVFFEATSINASRSLSAIAQFLVLIIVGYMCLFLLLSTNKQRSILLSRGVIRNILFVGYFGVCGRLLHTVPSSNRPATGIALLKNQLFVSYDQQVAVYCPTTFEMQHYLQFYCAYCGAMSTELAHHNHHGCRYYNVHGNIQDMVACDFSNCLYAARQNNSIYKFALGENNILYSWSVGSSPQGLSVTQPWHNLLVAMTDDNCLSEYSIQT